MLNPHRIITTATLLITLFVSSSVQATQHAATWLDAVDGNWETATLWSTSPIYPNNVSGGDSFTAMFDATGQAYAVSLNSNVELDTLTLDSADVSLVHDAGILHVLGDLNLNQGQYIFNGGLLRQARVVSNGDGSFLVPEGKTVTLDNVTIGATLNVAREAKVLVTNSLTLDEGTIILGENDGWNTKLEGQGGLSLLGHGDIVMGGTNNTTNVYLQTTGGTLLIDSQITVHAEWNGSIGHGSLELNNKGTIIVDKGLSLKGQRIVNHGLIKARDGGTITFNGGQDQIVNHGVIEVGQDATINFRDKSWTNQGIFKINGGTIYLGGTVIPSDLGTIERTGGRLVFAGVTLENQGRTLIADGQTGDIEFESNWQGHSVVHGGTLEARDGSRIHLAGHLENVTLTGDFLSKKYIVIESDESVNLSNATITTSKKSYWDFRTNTSITGSGEFIIQGGTSLDVNGNGFEIGPEVRIQVANGALGIYAHSNNSYLKSWVNRGRISVDSPESVLILGAAWKNEGVIQISDGRLTLNGEFTQDDLGVIERTGGTVYLGGILDNTGQTFLLDSQTGSWEMGYGGVIRGGTLEMRDGARLFGERGVLSGVTLAPDANIQVQSLSIKDGLSLNGNSLVASLGFSGTQILTGPGQIVAGKSKSDQDSVYNMNINGTLTIGEGVTVKTGFDSLNVIPNSDTGRLINRGLLLAQTPDRHLTLSGRGRWTNQGTMRLEAGTLNLGGNFASADVGHLEYIAGDLNITGILDNEGAALTVDPQVSPWRLAGGQILGGTVTSTNGGRLQVVSDSFGTVYNEVRNLFQGVTLDADVDLKATMKIKNNLTLQNGHQIVMKSQSYPQNNTSYGKIVTSGNQTINGQGTIVFDLADSKSYIIASSGSLTLGPDIVLKSGAGDGRLGDGSNSNSSRDRLYINKGRVIADVADRTIFLGSAYLSHQDRFINRGTIEAKNGGTVQLDSLWTNEGVIQVDQGRLNLNGLFSHADIGVIERTGGTIAIGGEMDNTNHLFQLNNQTGSWQLNDGKIIGGTIATTQEVALSIHNGSTLNGVTLAGQVDVEDHGRLYIDNDLMLHNGIVRMLGQERETTIRFHDDAILGGTGQIVFDGPAVSMETINNKITSYYNNNSVSLTIEPDITIRTGTGDGQISVPNMVQHGMILAENQGRVLSISSSGMSNQGQLEARSGATLLIASDWTNASDGTIASQDATLSLGGSWSNYGTIEANGGVVQLGSSVSDPRNGNSYGTWSNMGTIIFNNATVDLAGSTTTNALRSIQFNNCQMELSGLLINSNDTLTLDATTGSWGFSGTIRNGTVATHDGTTLQVPSGASVKLDNVILQANWIIDSGPDAADDQLSRLTLDGDWSVDGSIHLVDAHARLDGNFDKTKLDTITHTGRGQVVIAGALDNTHSVEEGDPRPGVLDIDGATGPISLDRGTITGGRLIATQGSALSISSYSNTLQNVQLEADLFLPDRASGVLTSGRIGAGLQFDLQGSSNLRLLLNQSKFQKLTVNFGSEQNSVNGKLTLEGPTAVFDVDSLVQVHNGSGKISLKTQMINEGQMFCDGGRLVIQSLDGGYDPQLNLDNLFTNKGILKVADGGIVTLNTRWTNQGTMILNEGTLRLGGPFTYNDLGTIQRTGSQIEIFGDFDNTGRQLAPTDFEGGWKLIDGGTIHGGTIKGTSGWQWTFDQSGQYNLNNLVVEADVHVADTAKLSLYGNVEFHDATIELDVTNYASGPQIQSTGTVQLTGSTELVFGTSSVDRSVRFQLQNGAMTIGPDAIVRTGTQFGLLSASYHETSGITNQGLISAQTDQQTLSLYGGGAGLTNLGVMEAINGGTLLVSKLKGNAGQIQIGDSSLVILDGAYAIDQPITIDNNARLALKGTWTNPGGIMLNEGQLILGGTIASDQIPGLTRTGGEVLIAGSYDNTAKVLSLDAFGGDWQLAKGGYITGGEISAADGKALRINQSSEITTDPARLNQVDLYTDLHIRNGAYLVLQGQSHLFSKKVTLASEELPATLSVASEASVNTPVEMIFDGDPEAEGVNRLYFGDGTLGEDVLIRTGTKSGEVRLYRYLNLYGKISAQTPDQTLNVGDFKYERDSVYNFGVLEAINNSHLKVKYMKGPMGEIHLDSGGHMTLYGNTLIIDKALTVDNGSWLTLFEKVTILEPIHLKDGALELDIDRFKMKDFYAKVNWTGGDFYCGFGINLSEEMGGVLDLDAQPGQWEFRNGYVTDGTIQGVTRNLHVQNSSVSNITLETDMVVAAGNWLNISTLITGHGTIHFDDAEVRTSGYLETTIASGITLTTAGSDGLFTVEKALFNEGHIQAIHGSNLHVAGEATASMFTNIGRIDVSDGELTVTSPLANQGVIELTGQASATYDKLVSGTGVFIGGVHTINGELSPGLSSEQNIGTLLFQSDLVLAYNSQASFELAGNGQGEFDSLLTDHLQIDGDLTFGGILSVVLLDDYQPEFGHTFALLDFDSSQGEFYSLSLPQLSDGLVWDTRQLYTDGTISVIVLGDINGDGFVDGFDVDPFVDLVLAGTYNPAGDINHDGVINGFDVDPFIAVLLGVSTPQTGREVPEPWTLTILGFGLMGMKRCAKRNNSENH